jgi:hypothetical protein
MYLFLVIFCYILNCISSLTYIYFLQILKYKKKKVLPVESCDSNALKPFPSSIASIPEYDHILVGHDISTLYTAALLSKAGHRCCVLIDKNAPPLSFRPDPEVWPYEVPLKNAVISRPDRYQVHLHAMIRYYSCFYINMCVMLLYQVLLDRVQDLSASKRVVFSPLGKESDGYTHSVITTLLPGKGGKERSADISRIFPLKTGLFDVTSDLSRRHRVDQSAVQDFFSRIAATQELAQIYLANKISSSMKISIDPEKTKRGGHIYLPFHLNLS